MKEPSMAHQLSHPSSINNPPFIIKMVAQTIYILQLTVLEFPYETAVKN